MKNLDSDVVEDFGREWQAFDQSELPDEDALRMFGQYFSLFDFTNLGEGFDLGCGSGRWAKLVAPKVGRLNCIDPSDAIDVARREVTAPNVHFFRASADDIPLADGSQDFGYCLGVLHHISDTESALRNAVRKLKPGAQFLIYVYYRFDNRPGWFRALWGASDAARKVISRLPYPLKRGTAFLIAATVYWPLAKVSRFAGPHFPLAWYGDKSFYVMATDALDRFGTRLEKRFTRPEIEALMEKCGLTNIRFRDGPPYWCALGVKR